MMRFELQALSGRTGNAVAALFLLGHYGFLDPAQPGALVGVRPIGLGADGEVQFVTVAAVATHLVDELRCVPLRFDAGSDVVGHRLEHR